VTSSGKMELLFNEAKTFKVHMHLELKDIRQVGEKVIRTEGVSEMMNRNWPDHADLLFLESLAEHDCGVYARAVFPQAMKLWDGKGFMDLATKKYKKYATCKLALAILAACLAPGSTSLPSELLPTLLKMQAPSGGWITDHAADGKPVGLANVETTCLAMLALRIQSRFP
jgi:hypothetical protein